MFRKSRSSRRRRRLLVALACLMATLCLAGGWVSWVYIDAAVSTVGTSTFDNELAVPPLAPGRISGTADSAAVTTPLSGINGARMAMDRIDLTVVRGTAETWTVHNRDGMPHNFHVHDVQFRVLSVDGAAPPPELTGAKDTVFLPPDATVRLAMRFDGPANPDAPYMYHCHPLSHEDLGMMGQFVVVEAGQSAGAPRPSPGAPAGHGH